MTPQTHALIAAGRYEVATFHDEHCDTSTVTRLTDGARSIWTSRPGELDNLYATVERVGDDCTAWIPA